MRDLLAGGGFRWWIAGGWAVELAGGASRAHGDTDVVVLFDELDAVRAHLHDHHLWEAHDGSLRPLLEGEELRPEREQLWVRRDAASPWLADLLLTRSDAGRWLFKRDHRISLPLDALGSTRDGIAYLRPEVVLLHKAHRVRPKDDEDFASLLPLLDASARTWLEEALALVQPDHAWRALLR